MNKKLIIGLGVVSVFATVPVSATIIPFSDLNLANYGQISQDYGDNVNSFNDGVGSYLQGNGFTPNISLSYQTTDAQNNTVEDWIEYWSTNYGDLTDVAFPGQNGHFAEITLTPELGYSVTLNGFDMAGWSKTDRVPDVIQVLDENGTILWDSGVNIVHGAGAIHDSFSPNISSDSEITIRWGTDWNIGIDNIDFDQNRTDGGEEVANDCVAIYKTDGSLHIPCVNVPDVFGGNTLYQADLQLIAFSSPLSFELKDAQLQQQPLENDVCAATYNTDNSLNIPCVSVSNPFGGITMYQAEMQLKPLSSPFAFELTAAQQK